MGCERCAELEEEIRHLKRERGADAETHDVVALRRHGHLTGMQARLCLAMYRTRRVMTINALLDVCEINSDLALKTHIHRIRTAFGAGAIVTEKGRGYGLSALGLEKVGHALGEERLQIDALVSTEPVDVPVAIAILAGRHAHQAGAGAAIQTLERIINQLEAHRG